MRCVRVRAPTNRGDAAATAARLTRDRMMAALLFKSAAMLVSGQCVGAAEVPGNASASAATTTLSTGNATNATTTTVDGLPIRDAGQLQAAINASIAAGNPGYSVASGAYYFNDGSPLLVYRARRWSLIGVGRVELWFRTSPSRSPSSISSSKHLTATADVGWTTGGVLVLECEDVRIEGLTIDYHPPAFYQGTVLPPSIEDAPCAPEPCPRGRSHAGRSYCPSDPTKGQCDKPPRKGPCPPGPCGGAAAGMRTVLVRTDPGFPEPHEYIESNRGADPADKYSKAASIWPKRIDFGCNRTWGCPGHGAAVLQPLDNSLPRGINKFELLSTTSAGDKVTVHIRKGITYHVQNSTRISSFGINIHGASMFGISEYDGGGNHSYENVWLGRRRGVNSTQLCGRAPGRLCLGLLVSNADGFHSSGCKDGASLRNVTLSYMLDDYLNVHSRLQFLGKRVSTTELIILDPRLSIARGVPDDNPYGAAETMTNAKPGDVLEFHELNTFVPLGEAKIASIQRLSDPADVKRYGDAAVVATTGATPYRMNPPLSRKVQPDVGQICGAYAAAHGLPKCASRVWRVTFVSAVPAAVTSFDLVSLRGWDNAGLSVTDSHFFGGVDGVHVKSSGAVIRNNVMACVAFGVSPWQAWMEGPPHVRGLRIQNNTFTACGGVFGTYGRVNCSGANNGTSLPILNKGVQDGFCTSPGGLMVPSTCNMTTMTIEDNHAETDCTLFRDEGAQRTCCSACAHRCRGCDRRRVPGV